MIRIFILCLLTTLPLIAQVNNTAQTLSPGTYSLSVAPIYIEQADDDDLDIYFFFDYGVRSGFDLSLRIGTGETPYFGMDAEWELFRRVPYLSFSAGGHYQNGVGTDATLLTTIPLNHKMEFFTGIDSDLEFNSNGVSDELWWALGVEVILRRKLVFLLEGDVPLSADARPQADLALKVYF
ncbi:MAG: hypothetical protein AAFP70_13445 [Calditrichota bacterium]